MAQNPTATVLVKTPNLNNALKNIQDRFSKFGKKLSENRLKIMAMWSYGNQIANMILAQLSQAAKGTAAQAGIQKVIQGLSFAQSEFAIIQTFLQAAAATTAGNIPGGALLYTVATLMQSTLVAAQSQRLQLESAQLSAERIRRQIEAYRT